MSGSERAAFQVALECESLGLRSGAIAFRGVRIAPDDEVLRAEIRRAAAEIQARFAAGKMVKTAPEVEAYGAILRRVGVNPRREQASLERLWNAAIKRGDLPNINTFVDSYNLVSVRCGFSLGAHDLDRLAPPVTLRMLNGSESFTKLGASEPEACRAQEFGYVDAENRVICRLDLYQADFSRVTTATTNALLIVEGTEVHAAADLEAAFQDAIETVTRYCGGTAEILAMPRLI